MKLVTYAVPVLILLLSFFYNTNPFIVKEEAQEAYEYLHATRPGNKGLLRWSDTLARVAEAKALDMAKRNYTGHTDPDGYDINYYLLQSGYALNTSPNQHPGDHVFESLSAGSANGSEAIQKLLLDKDFPKWNNTQADIGIGFVKCDVGKHRSYVCILVAKHD
jgi:hypothetical protein